MTDVGASESAQILSPEIQHEPLRQALKLASDIAKKEIQDNDQVIIKLDCAGVSQDFGLFKEARIGLGVYTLLNQNGTIWGTSEGHIETKEPKYYSHEDVEMIAKQLREKYGLGVETSLSEEDQKVYVTEGDAKVMIDFGFPSREAAIAAYKGRTDAHLIDPQTIINVSAFAGGEDLSVKIEDRGSIPVEENMEKLVASVPKSIDLMTKVMETMNSLAPQDNLPKIPKLINWVDTELSEPLVDSGRSSIYNKNHEIVGTILTVKAKKALERAISENKDPMSG